MKSIEIDYDYVPICIRRRKESKTAYIKRYTKLLYDCLPPAPMEEREKYLGIRDKIIELNYSLFGYIVSTKFLNCTYASYQDKVQACIARFCTCWAWYRSEERCNRPELSFAVFYTPRLGEMLERDFNEVKYSLRRSLMLEVGEQIGKKWMDVTYDDLKDPRVNIPPEHKASLMAIFGSLYPGSSDEISIYLEAPDEITEIVSVPEQFDENYEQSDYISLLVQEMVENERKLTNKDINHLAEVFQLDAKELRSLVPAAEEQLYEILTYRKYQASAK